MLNLFVNLANILAQVNFGANSASLLGIFLYFAGAPLCSLGLFRPNLARNHDILFAQGLGWRLDPILQFGQLLLITIAIAYTVESVKLRRNQRP